jgi:hypothetical protein
MLDEKKMSFYLYHPYYRSGSLGTGIERAERKQGGSGASLSCDHFAENGGVGDYRVGLKEYLTKHERK